MQFFFKDAIILPKNKVRGAKMLEKLITIEGYELITIQQAADLCGVMQRTIHNWIIDERLGIKYKAGRTILLNKKEVVVASKSYQTTKPRSRKPQDIRKAA